MLRFLLPVLSVLLGFSLLSPARFLPDLVAFKSALFSFSLVFALVAYSLSEKILKFSKNIVLTTIFVATCSLFTDLLNFRGESYAFSFGHSIFSIIGLILGALCAQEKSGNWLYAGIVGGALFLALFAMLSWHGIYFTSEYLQFYIPIDQQGDRARSGLGQSNNFGVLCVTCVWLIWGALFRFESKGALKFFGWLLILILLQGIFVSYSRTAVLGFVLATLYLLFIGLQSGFGKIQWRHGLPLVAYIFVVVVYRWFFNGDARAASVEGFANGDAIRFRMWAMAIEAIVEKPLFGWGFGTIPAIALEKSVAYGAFDYSILSHFHNTPLDLLVQFGLVGGGALLAFFVYLLILAWRGSRNIQNGDVLFAAGIPLLLHAMLEYPFSYGFLFWPFCIWLGYLVSFSSTSVIKAPRLVAVPIALAFLSFWYIWYSSYMRVESIYTQVRQGYEVTADAVESETSWFEDFAFRHYIDRLKWVLEPVTPQNKLSDTQIAELDRVARMYPTDLLLWKNAIARATRGEVSGAAWWAERMCRMYEPSVCDRAASAWQSIEVKDWPVLPWDQWRQK
jgi:Virulence factor membrane-bound polymerase, C-terminal/O-Antigen ligase